MTLSNLRYTLPHGLGVIKFSSKVLLHFEKHKQSKVRFNEAGGQLFAVAGENGCTEIVDITGPRATDKRRRNEYIPDRVAEQQEIVERYSHGLHFIGDWHTHREEIPIPSLRDQKSMRELVSLSGHNLKGFIMVIVGLDDFPRGMNVTFHTEKCSKVLSPLT